MRKGFTLIELIITLAVAVILTSVGVARYSNFINQQDFLANAQTIEECMQKGQQLALTGGTLNNVTADPIRFVVVTAWNSNSSTAQCEIDGYPDGSGTTISLLQAKVPNSNLLSSYTLSNVQLNNRFGIVFGVVEHGLPLNYSTDGLTSAVPSGSVLGFPSSFSLHTATGDYVQTSITLGQTGTPILLGKTSYTP